jgi:hypothetical protein
MRVLHHFGGRLLQLFPYRGGDRFSGHTMSTFLKVQMKYS